jgi:hypothetical protein
MGITRVDAKLSLERCRKVESRVSFLWTKTIQNHRFRNVYPSLQKTF